MKEPTGFAGSELCGLWGKRGHGVKGFGQSKWKDGVPFRELGKVLGELSGEEVQESVFCPFEV